jgi:hypothetical protein
MSVLKQAQGNRHRNREAQALSSELPAGLRMDVALLLARWQGIMEWCLAQCLPACSTCCFCVFEWRLSAVSHMP